MAKNISNNQWFKDIIDNVYLNTAVINNILFITVKTNNIKINAKTTIAKLRNPKLFHTNYLGQITSHGIIISVVNGFLFADSNLDTGNIGLVELILKSKQLETDFYSPEQLAEMYPNDPSYQVATPGIMNDDIPDKENSEPTIEPTISDTEPTITSEVSNNDEPY